MLYLNNLNLILRFFGVGLVVFAIYWFHFKPISDLENVIKHKNTIISTQKTTIKSLKIKMESQKEECKQQNLNEFLNGLEDDNETTTDINLLNLHT